MKSLKLNWYNSPQKEYTWTEYIEIAKHWFLNSDLVKLKGVEYFPFVDVTTGNTHYIESLVSRFGWNGFQILKQEYAYYKLMGKHGVELDQLEPNKPMIVTVPDFFTGGIRNEWQDLLDISQERKIDLHLDLAWMVMAHEIELDFTHPCIKSFGMSMSKLHLNWNRVGLRWSRQRTMDSITILNHYYKADINTNIFSCGAYHMQNLDRDYAWNTYGYLNKDICKQLDLKPSKFVHCVYPSNQGLECITPLLIKYAS